MPLPPVGSVAIPQSGSPAALQLEKSALARMRRASDMDETCERDAGDSRAPAHPCLPALSSAQPLGRACHLGINRYVAVGKWKPIAIGTPTYIIRFIASTASGTPILSATVSVHVPAVLRCRSAVQSSP
jgi:hypothetical protein